MKIKKKRKPRMHKKKVKRARISPLKMLKVVQGRLIHPRVRQRLKERD